MFRIAMFPHSHMYVHESHYDRVLRAYGSEFIIYEAM